MKFKLLLIFFLISLGAYSQGFKKEKRISGQQQMIRWHPRRASQKIWNVSAYIPMHGGPVEPQRNPYRVPWQPRGRPWKATPPMWEARSPLGSHFNGFNKVSRKFTMSLSIAASGALQAPPADFMEIMDTQVSI